jgi:hypothetical protein
MVRPEQKCNRACSSCVVHLSIHFLVPSRANTGTDLVAPRPIALERSKTTLQAAAGIRPDAATILASRRSQSVSNPANVPPPPFASNPSRSNTSLGRSNTTRVARNATTNAGVMPLRVKTPQGTAPGIAGIGADSSRAAGESGAAAGGAPTTLRRPSLRRPKGQEAPPVPQLSALQQPPQPLQPGQYMNDTQGVTPFVLPAAPTPAQGGGSSSSLCLPTRFI